MLMAKLSPTDKFEFCFGKTCFMAFNFLYFIAAATTTNHHPSGNLPIETDDEGEGAYHFR